MDKRINVPVPELTKKSGTGTGTHTGTDMENIYNRNIYNILIHKLHATIKILFFYPDIIPSISESYGL